MSDIIQTLPSNDGSISFSLWNWMRLARNKLVRLDSNPPTYNNFIGNKTVGMWEPSSAVGESFGMGGTATTTKASSALVASTTTNVFTQQRRVTFTSTAAINTGCGIIHPNAPVYRGDAQSKGGFLIWGWMGFTALNSDSRWGFGLHNAATVPTGNTDPSTLTNVLFIGQDAADTNIKVISANGSTSTKQDLGTGLTRPTVSQSMYLLGLYAAPYSNFVEYYIYNRYTSASAQGKISLTLPVNTAQMYFTQFVNTGPTTATASTIACGKSYLETPY